MKFKLRNEKGLNNLNGVWEGLNNSLKTINDYRRIFEFPRSSAPKAEHVCDTKISFEQLFRIRDGANVFLAVEICYTHPLEQYRYRFYNSAVNNYYQSLHSEIRNLSFPETIEVLIQRRMEVVSNESLDRASKMGILKVIYDAYVQLFQHIQKLTSLVNYIFNSKLPRYIRDLRCKIRCLRSFLFKNMDDESAVIVFNTNSQKLLIIKNNRNENNKIKKYNRAIC